MKGIPGKHLISIAAFLAFVAPVCGAGKDAPGIDPGQVYEHKAGWSHTMLACRKALQHIDLPAKDKAKLSTQVYARVMQDFPVRADWMLQDYGRDAHQWFLAADTHAQQIRMI